MLKYLHHLYYHSFTFQELKLGVLQGIHTLLGENALPRVLGSMSNGCKWMLEACASWKKYE